MSFRFIYGRSGSGKTMQCILEIKNIIDKDENDSKLLLIVPEQYTFVTENKILKYIGEKALLRTQVLSFKKMAHMVFDEIGGRAKSIINESGKRMLINKVLNQNIESLDYLKKISKRHGFNDVVSEIISEFKKYNVSYDSLYNVSQQVDKKELSEKVNDLATIYEKLDEKMHANYIDSDDELTLLYKLLMKDNIFKDCYIWVDEFSTFIPQQLNILEILAKGAKEINVTLTLDKKSSNESIFLPVLKTESKLLKLVENNNISYKKPMFLNESDNFRFKNSKELLYIEKYFFAYPIKTYNDKVKNISIYKANNTYEEIEKVAQRIIEFVRDKNYRYKDICVVCRNIDDYDKITAAIFDEYNIPYFIDRKLNLAANPLIIFITSIFEIFISNFSYESMFRYLKSGLLNINRADIDSLENFVLERGIKGSLWIEYKKDDQIEENEKEMCCLMKEISQPLKDFFDKISNKNTVKSICKNLYNFLNDMNVFEKINLWIDEFSEKKLEYKVREYSQIEQIVIDTLDQAVDVIGDDIIDVKEFYQILNYGFSNQEIGVIPVALDQVNIGDVGRVKGKDAKIVFIVGVNDGVFPSNRKEEGILKDDDRNILNSLGITLASDTRKKVYEEEFTLYTALTISSEYLFLSYPIADFEGKSLRPSVVIPKMKKIFKNIHEQSSIYDLQNEDNNYKKIVAPIPTFNDLILAIRRDFEKKDVERYWPSVFKWYKNDDRFKNKIKIMFDGINYTNIGDTVNKNKLRELYKNDVGKLSFSVSRVEKYASCPFSYFIQYGLKAKNRKLYEFTPPDIGSLVHDILDRFTKRIKSEGILWSELDNTKCKNYVDSLIQERLDQNNNSILLSSKRYKHFAKRITNVISKSILVLSKQISNGQFEVFKTEYPFTDKSLELNDNEKVYFEGRIDRIDTLDLDGNVYIRIIDYKTGNKKFDLNELYYGIQIQLLVYLDILLKNSEKILNSQARPGAVLYFKVDDPIIQTNSTISKEEAERKILEKLKLKGLLIKDIKVIKAMDKDIGTSSLIIPASIKKDDSFYAKSSVITENDFDILRNYVNKKMKDLCEEMLSGKISINPIKNCNITYCSYCEYAAICQFDTNISGNKYNAIKARPKKEVWQDIKDKLEKEKK